jgi:L-alanine-DL-glutamate epimerase-like enolase superfamily enzyme
LVRAWLSGSISTSLPAEDAVPFIRALESDDLTLPEPPVPRDRTDDPAANRRGIRIPLMADESVVGPRSLIAIIRQEAADIVNVKVMK